MGSIEQKAQGGNGAVICAEGVAHVVPHKINLGGLFPYSMAQCALLIAALRLTRVRIFSTGKILADQTDEHSQFSDEVGRIVLKKARQDAEDLDVQYVDQLIPRLVEKKYGPVLVRVSERQGTYEFVNPILRQYVRLRQF